MKQEERAEKRPDKAGPRPIVRFLIVQGVHRNRHQPNRSPVTTDCCPGLTLPAIPPTFLRCDGRQPDA